jgi:hypothetical protein
MNFKKAFLLAVISSVLSILASLIYNKVYSGSFYVDFSKIINPGSVIMNCLVGCTLMSLGYVLVMKWRPSLNIAWLNIVYTVLSFASIVMVLSFKLPLDIEFPELFPGLAIPMHFFPVLAFLTIVPFFKTNRH